MIKHSLRSLALTLGSTAAAVAAAGALSVGPTGCTAAGDDELVRGRVAVINRVQSALSDTDVALMTLEGTYGAACSGHSALGTDTWTSADLAVRKNDNDCILTIKSLVVGETSYRTASSNDNIVLDVAD